MLRMMRQTKQTLVNSARVIVIASALSGRAFAQTSEFQKPTIPEKRCQVAVVPLAAYSLNIACSVSTYWMIGASAIADIKTTNLGETDQSRILLEGPSGISLPFSTPMTLDQTKPFPVIYARRLLSFADEDFSPFVSLIAGRGGYAIRETVETVLHVDPNQQAGSRLSFRTSAYDFTYDYTYNFVNVSAGVIAHPRNLGGFLFGAEFGFSRVYAKRERRHVIIDPVRVLYSSSISPDQAATAVLLQRLEPRRPQASVFLIPWIGYQVVFQ